MDGSSIPQVHLWFSRDGFIHHRVILAKRILRRHAPSNIRLPNDLLELTAQTNFACRD